MYSFIQNPNHDEGLVILIHVEKFAFYRTGLESENFYSDCWPIVQFLDSSRPLQPYLHISDPNRKVI
jgi:hypothetical protein